MKKLEPTADNLCNIDNWEGKEHFSYQYSDFMYCKDYPNISNDRLLTLRRFPFLVCDNGSDSNKRSKNLAKPIAKAITWIDDINKVNDYFLSSQSFKILFSYELKPFGGINMKTALHDIIVNFLTLTNNDSFTSSDAYTIANEIDKKITSDTSNISSIISDAFENPIRALCKLVESINLSKTENPIIVAEPNELTGNCHLMVGNPFNPSLMVGNLIVTGANLKFADDAHIDGIPSKLDIEVMLKHSKPRGESAIENCEENNKKTRFEELKDFFADIINDPRCEGYDAPGWSINRQPDGIFKKEPNNFTT